ncbi:MAG: permease prefix domain 1-containing protein [Nitriliruptoraceae bacterium]
MSSIDAQLATWREFVSAGGTLDRDDVDELESHLREQIDELEALGLRADEAFLVAVKRVGTVDALTREFAREHSGRLWKQLVLMGDGDDAGGRGSWLDAVLFAGGAALAAHVVRLIAGFPDDESMWLGRNLAFVVLPFLVAYFAHRRGLGARHWAVLAGGIAAVAVLINVYPYRAESATELLVALHLPVLLWFVVGVAYLGGEVWSRERRMDFVRFTGEWFIYYVLIALGGGVLMALTMLVLSPLGPEMPDLVAEWVLPAGIPGAVVIAAWLVESKQRVIENMAPVLTMVFTPLFAVMLAGAAIVHAVTGLAGAFDRELLAGFDALLVVVLGLVLYGMSARDPSAPPGWMDRMQLVAVVSALALDLMVFGTMVVRIGELGLTPNRVAALGLNLVLLVNLAGAAWWSTQFLSGRTTFHRLEQWQTTYLPVFAGWIAFVVLAVPPLFLFG